MAPLRVNAIALGASPPATRRMYFTVISGRPVSDSVTPSIAEVEVGVEVDVEVEARSLRSGGLIVTTTFSSCTKLAGSLRLSPMVDRSALLKVSADTSAYVSPPTI
jgi:hypothetical protein